MINLWKPFFVRFVVLVGDLKLSGFVINLKKKNARSVVSVGDLKPSGFVINLGKSVFVRLVSYGKI